MSHEPDITPAVVPKKGRIPGEPEHPPIENMSEEKKGQIEKQLLSGELEPSNEMVVFLLGRIQNIQIAGSQLAQMRAQLVEKVKEVENQIKMTKGALNQYLADLVECQLRNPDK